MLNRVGKLPRVIEWKYYGLIVPTAELCIIVLIGGIWPVETYPKLRVGSRIGRPCDSATNLGMKIFRIIGIGRVELYVDGRRGIRCGRHIDLAFSGLIFLGYLGMTWAGIDFFLLLRTVHFELPSQTVSNSNQLVSFFE